ncbi:DrmB family protein [Geodermatophilus sp. SYSU D00703]
MSSKPKTRRSQLISTFGVGGLFPSENTSYMIAGLQDWDPEKAEPASEPRLARSLGVSALKMPPAGGHRDVPVIRFPRTQICPDCRRIGNLTDFQSPWNQAVCNLCKPSAPLSPSRLIVACPKGHIGEFPYFAWVHSGSGQRADGQHRLTLRSKGRTSSLADLVVECSCGVPPIGLDGSFDQGALAGVIRCRGERPWMGAGAAEDCTEVPRTLQRGASNVWFPAVRSAISIPPFSEALARFVDREWGMLKNPQALTTAWLIDGLVTKSNGRFTAEEIVREARRRHEEDTEEAVTETSLRRDEYRALLDGRVEDHDGSDFVCLVRPVPDELAEHVLAVRKVTRLREVRALYGFSRLSAASDPSDPRLCSLSPEKLNWLPAIQVIGEGVFLQLRPDDVRGWASRPFAQRRRKLLQAAADRAARAARLPAARQIDIAQVMVHTFAHVLIDQLALDAGYPAASIRERLFVDEGMAGVLLYTATSDSAGSLGGLAAQAESDKLGSVVLEGLHRLRWCSSDPVCIESTGTGTDGLNLAACHACVLVPETSCEEQNVLLDRGLLFGTPENPEGGFFSDLRSAVGL